MKKRILSLLLTLALLVLPASAIGLLSSVCRP